MKATIQIVLCLVLTLCLLSAAPASCAAKTEEVYLNSFTRFFDGSNNLLDLRSYTSTETLTAEKRVVCIITVEKNSAGQVTSRVTDRKDTGNTESYTATYSEAGDLLRGPVRNHRP